MLPSLHLIVQDLAEHLSAWAAITGEPGLVTVDCPALPLGRAPPPCALLSPVLDAWRAVHAVPLVEGPELLAAAAAAGLVSRPHCGWRSCR